EARPPTRRSRWLLPGLVAAAQQGVRDEERETLETTLHADHQTLLLATTTASEAMDESFARRRYFMGKRLLAGEERETGRGAEWRSGVLCGRGRTPFTRPCCSRRRAPARRATRAW